MATTVDNLSVKWGADFRELLAEYKKGEQASAQFRQKISKEMDGARKAFDVFAAGLKGVVLGAISALSIGKIAGIARETLKWADDTSTLAERLNLTTDQLQQLLFAGREFNVTSQQMAAGLQSFWAKVSEAATGKGEGLVVLKQLGIDPASLKSADDALTKIAAKLRQFDRASQLTVAKTFFGDEKAAQFLQLMLGDIDAAKAKARELGVVIDGQLIAKGTELNKEFERVADVGMAAVRRQSLEIAIGFNEILRNASLLTPVLQEWGEKLGKSLVIAQGFKALFDAQQVIRDRMAQQPGTAARLAQGAAPGLQQAISTGTRRLNLDSGAASAMEQFEKQIQKARIEAMALRHELDFGKAAAANVKALEAFADAGGKFKPTTEQVRQFSRALKEIEAGKTALAFKEIGDENARLAQVIAAEVSGNRELVAILEQRFALERALGRTLTEAEAARAEALAKTRFQMEQLRERQQALKQDLEGLFDSMAGHAGQALDSILDKSKTVGEAMRDFFIAALRDIANEMFKLAAINPLKNLLFGQNNPTIGDVGGFFGSLFGGSASTGGIPIDPSMMFADGGRPPVGMPSIVGERGPELFVPDVAGTIVPNHKMGGGAVTYIDARGADQAAVSRLESIVRAQGSELRRWQAGEGTRVVGHVVDMKRRGGAAANVFA